MSASALDPVLTSASSIRVLLVEDQLFMRAGIRFVLRDKADIDVVADASSLAEALAIVTSRAIDVVILDLDLTSSPGTDAVRELLEAAPSIRVIALTRFPDDAQLVSALRLGASAYLPGDTPSDELATAVRSAAAGDLHIRPRLGNALAAAFRPPARAVASNARERYGALSGREQTVLRLVAEGYSGPEIGEMLNITAKTVDTYRHRIQGKIGLTHRTQYVRLALQLDLLGK